MINMHFRVRDNIYKWRDGIAYRQRESYFDIQENVTYPSKWVRVDGNPSLYQLMMYEGRITSGDYSVMLKEEHFTLVQSIVKGELLYELTIGDGFRIDTRAEVRGGYLWVNGLYVQMTPALEEFLWEVGVMTESLTIRELIDCEFRPSEYGTEILRNGQVIYVCDVHTVESLESLRSSVLRTLDIQERRVTEGDRRWLIATRR